MPIPRRLIIAGSYEHLDQDTYESRERMNRAKDTYKSTKTRTQEQTRERHIDQTGSKLKSNLQSDRDDRNSLFSLPIPRYPDTKTILSTYPSIHPSICPGALGAGCLLIVPSREINA